MLNKRPDPVTIDQVFSNDEYQLLKKDCKSIAKKIYYDNGFGRYATNDINHPFLKESIDKLVPLARQIFKSDTLLPSYAMFAHYEGPKANLQKHRDDNACTYTIDMCVYQNYLWDLWVENKPYTLQENQALAYYGNDQIHWRERFPKPDNQHVAMIFFHFVEPDHWYHTKGPDYLKVLRGRMTEEEFNALRQ
jgi:hypothetical protein